MYKGNCGNGKYLISYEYAFALNAHPMHPDIDQPEIKLVLHLTPKIAPL